MYVVLQNAYFSFSFFFPFSFISSSYFLVRFFLFFLKCIFLMKDPNIQPITFYCQLIFIIEEKKKRELCSMKNIKLTLNIFTLFLENHFFFNEKGIETFCLLSNQNSFLPVPMLSVQTQINSAFQMLIFLAIVIVNFYLSLA